jgi:lipopolysaccharide/colanic/teichoic acid biosynthesis glycosyltransferase
MPSTLDAPAESELLTPMPPTEASGRIRPHQPRPSAGYPAVKGAADFCLAVLLSIAAAPVVLLCALLIKLTSRGPAFYSQVRLGRGGKPYRIYKLRTMRHLCESSSGPQWSTAGDTRVTVLGRFLRRTHLDELPQLWNILRGEMSLVGPRPERPEFIPALAQAIPLYASRMEVRPGVTGLAQVQLPADTDLDSVRFKVAYDLYYVGRASFWMDVRILVATVGKVFGISFELLRMWFLLPTRTVVQTHYRGLSQGEPVSSRKESTATTRIEAEVVPAQRLTSYDWSAPATPACLEVSNDLREVIPNAH